MIKIYDMETLEEREILFRGGSGADVSAPVAEILRAVQERGDAALREYTLRFDGAAPDALAVTAEEVDQAAAQVEPAFLAVLEEAAEHIRAYHARQKRESFVMTEREGVVLGQRIIPLARVGIYVPGGTAAYPSTVLMNAIPARIAGVGEIIMVTPPGRDGAVNPHILAAAKIAGVTRIYKVGGAQAVAALAYGTGTIPQVDKIVGPGNAYVAEAKRQVFGRVNIDMIAGPSEVLVLADGRSNPAWVAADLLSQAEHDRMAAAVLVTDSRPWPRRWLMSWSGSWPPCPGQRSPGPPWRPTASSSSAGISGRASRWPTASPRSTWSCVWTTPSTTWGRFRTPAPSSWAVITRSPWGTTLPGPTTLCLPWAPPGSTVPCRWMTS